MSTPRIVCVACNKAEVGVYELVCSHCRAILEAAGLQVPGTPPLPKVQIGPTDI